MGFVACAQLVVGMVWSGVMWGTGMRKAPNLTSADIASCVPIGLMACLAHAGSVLAMGVGAVSFAQIVKACEPVFAAVIGILVPPMDIKPLLAYAMLIPNCWRRWNCLHQRRKRSGHQLHSLHVGVYRQPCSCSQRKAWWFGDENTEGKQRKEHGQCQCICRHEHHILPLHCSHGGHC